MPAGNIGNSSSGQNHLRSLLQPLVQRAQSEAPDRTTGGTKAMEQRGTDKTSSSSISMETVMVTKRWRLSFRRARGSGTLELM